MTRQTERQTWRLLIVGGGVEARAALRAVLRRDLARTEALAEADGPEAAARLDEVAPDCILLLDEEADGALSALFAALGARARVPVVVVVGGGGRARVRAALAAGAMETIGPEVSERGALVRAIESAIDRHELGAAQGGARQPMHEALARNEATLAAVIEGLPLGIGVTDATGRTLSQNPAALRVHGFSSLEQMPMALDRYQQMFELRHTDGRPMPMSDWPVARALRGDFVTECEARLVRPDGEERLVSYSAVPLRDERGAVTLIVFVIHDVTERRHAEAQLRASEARYRALFDAVDQGFCVVQMFFDDGGRAVDYLFLEANPAFERHTGLVGAVGKRVSALVPDLDESWFRTYGDVAKSGRSVRFENHAPAMNRWFDVYALRLGDPAQHKVGIFFSDVSARKETEAALRASETRARASAEAVAAERNLLDAILAAAPTGIVVAGATGELLRANAASERLWGRASDSGTIPSPRQWRGTWADGSERTGRPVAPDEWAVVRALRGEIVSSDVVEIVPFDDPGARRTLMCSASPVRDEAGRVVGAVAAQMDISELVAAESAMRRSEERYRLVSRATNDVIWDWDLQTDRLQWNEAVRQHLGLAPEALGPTIAGWHDRIHPDDRSRVVSGVRAAIDGGRDGWSDEYRFRRSDGSYATFLDRGYIGRDAAGKPYKMIGSMLDLSERRRAEEALREADRRKDEFLAILAHELRNPLAPVSTAVHLLRRIGPRDPAVERARDVIDRQVRHMARLIDDLLDVSRITRGKLQLAKERCDLRALVRQTAEDYRHNLEAAGLTVSIGASGAPIGVDGDPTRLVQMVGNLLHNASRFTPAGGRVAIEVGAEDGRHAVVRVEDNGVGMAPELLGRLFDPFSQAEQGLARSKGGLGLGLALTKGLAELHGGSVAAESAGVGRGATFTLRLPLAAAPEARASAGAAASPEALRVVLIEDNVDAAEMLSQLLTVAGHEVKVAFDGRTGIDAVRAFRPDVVISDLGLPGGTDGYAVARALRAEAPGPAPLLIALSGYAQEEDRRRSREAGFDAHLPKPPDLAQLEAMLSGARRADARAPLGPRT